MRTKKLFIAIAQRERHIHGWEEPQRVGVSCKPCLVDRIQLGRDLRLPACVIQRQPAQPSRRVAGRALNGRQIELPVVPLEVAVGKQLDLLLVLAHLRYHSAHLAQPQVNFQSDEGQSVFLAGPGDQHQQRIKQGIGMSPRAFR